MPPGNPEREMISAKAQPKPGTKSAGFKTTQLLKASAGATFQEGNDDWEIPRGYNTNNAQCFSGNFHINAGAHRVKLVANNAQRFIGKKFKHLTGTPGFSNAFW